MTRRVKDRSQKCLPPSIGIPRWTLCEVEARCCDSESLLQTAIIPFTLKGHIMWLMLLLISEVNRIFCAINHVPDKTDKSAIKRKQEKQCIWLSIVKAPTTQLKCSFGQMLINFHYRDQEGTQYIIKQPALTLKHLTSLAKLSTVFYEACAILS